VLRPTTRGREVPLEQWGMAEYLKRAAAFRTGFEVVRH
jgi:hypothetical protein